MKTNTDILNIIGGYVRLTVRGDKATGLCPFHDDRNPSLQVYQNRGRYICYACGAKGDTIDFIRRIENCSFPEALEKAGIRTDKKAKTPKPVSSQENLITIPEKRPAPPDHTKFLGLLMPWHPGDSGLSATYLDFEVGLSPALIPPEWRGMEHRIIFPLRDHNGNLTGFAGRAANEALKPKYLNTSSAHGYNRNEHLYGWWQAKQSIQCSGEVFVTEGYKDALAMHAAGFTNTVALGGTAVSDKQLALLAAGATHIRLVMDADEAGRKAATVIQSACTKHNLYCRKIGLPEGEDPDSLFRSLGKEAFRNYILTESLRPGMEECRLITALTYHPTASLYHEGIRMPAPAVIRSFIENQYISFSDSSHTALLIFLAENSLSGSPKLPEGKTADTITHLQTRYGNETEDTTEEPAIGIARLLQVYMESYLLEDIRRISGILRHHHTTESRKQLFHHLAYRKHQLKEISAQLYRPSTSFGFIKS